MTGIRILTQKLYDMQLNRPMILYNPSVSSCARGYHSLDRVPFMSSLLSQAELNPALAISADLGNSSGLSRFRLKYPERFLNINAEQHMIGFARVYLLVDLTFFVLVCAFYHHAILEQVRMNLGYMQSNVKIVSIGSGISMGYLGNSHFGLEDILLFVLSPISL